MFPGGGRDQASLVPAELEASGARQASRMVPGRLFSAPETGTAASGSRLVVACTSGKRLAHPHFPSPARAEHPNFAFAGAAGDRSALNFNAKPLEQMDSQRSSTNSFTGSHGSSATQLFESSAQKAQANFRRAASHVHENSQALVVRERSPELRPCQARADPEGNVWHSYCFPGSHGERLASPRPAQARAPRSATAEAWRDTGVMIPKELGLGVGSRSVDSKLASLELALDQVKNEVQDLRGSSRAAISELRKVDILQQELRDQHALQLALRQELDSVLRDEVEARCRDVSALRADFAQFRQELRGGALRMPEHCATDQAAEERVRTSFEQAAAWDSTAPEALHLPVIREAEAFIARLTTELELECQQRCARDADLHARVDREVADLYRCVERQRVVLRDEMSEVTKNLEGQHMEVKGAVSSDREKWDREAKELRAILENVWQHAGGKAGHVRDQSYYLKFIDDEGEARYKEFVGDEEDIYSLYEMTRDVVSELAPLKEHVKQINAEMEQFRPLHKPTYRQRAS